MGRQGRREYLQVVPERTEITSENGETRTVGRIGVLNERYGPPNKTAIVSEVVLTLPVGCDLHYVSRDRKWILCSLVESMSDVWMVKDFDPYVH